MAYHSDGGLSFGQEKEALDIVEAMYLLQHAHTNEIPNWRGLSPVKHTVTFSAALCPL
jgi:hypothetical protein